MARFEPQLNEDLCFNVDGADRRFSPVEHPRAPAMVHAMEGGKAQVFRLRSFQDGSEYALKVMRPKHRDPALSDICAFLDRLKDRPGLTVCERLCLSPNRAAKTIGEYPSLEYAILMPWIAGTSWFDLLFGRGALGQGDCLDLATNLAGVLATLESEEIAHCDLSSGNLLLDRATLQVELIDVEDLYSPGAPSPKAPPAGTAGYQHCTSAQGQWSPQADRFAGAILLSEILGWYDSAVRAASHGESFFDPVEVQGTCSRFTLLAAAVRRQRARLGDLLEKAWRSRTLAECPKLSEWHQACQGTVEVTWKKLPNVPAPTIGSSMKPFWAPLPSSGSAQGPTVQWKQGGAATGAGSPAVTWKGGVGGDQ